MLGEPLRKLQLWEGLRSSQVSLEASWEGLRSSWEGPQARWEGLRARWEGGTDKQMDGKSPYLVMP